MFINNKVVNDLCEAITTSDLAVYIRPDGLVEYRCPICGATDHVGDVMTMKTIEHRTYCAYSVAEDTLEKKGALITLENDVIEVFESISLEFIRYVELDSNTFSSDEGICRYCGTKYYDVNNMIEESKDFSHEQNCIMLKIRNIIDRLRRIR